MDVFHYAVGNEHFVDLFMIPKFVNRNNAIVQLPRLEKGLEKLKELKNRFAKNITLKKQLCTETKKNYY